MDIQLNQEKSRFEATVENQLCVLEFSLDDNVISMNHVRVPEPVGGRGIAGTLTRHALDHAANRGWWVVANCPYVKKWIERHPEYHYLTDNR